MLHGYYLETKYHIVFFFSNIQYYCNIFFQYTLSISRKLWHFLRGVPSIIVYLLTSIIAIHKFFKEQRFNRVIKIYYEDGIVDIINQAKEMLSVVSYNKIIFETLNTYLNNKIKAALSLESKNMRKFKEIFIEITQSNYIKYLVSEIKIIKIKTFNQKVINIISTGYFSNWYPRMVEDIARYTLKIRNIAANYEDYMSYAQSPFDFTIATLDSNVKHIQDTGKIIDKHAILLGYMTNLRDLIAEKNFYNIKNLINRIARSKKLSEFISKFDEAYKVFFCYFYDKNKNHYISYMCKYGNPIIIQLDENKKPINIILDDTSITENTKNLPLLELNIYEQFAISELPMPSIDSNGSAEKKNFRIDDAQIALYQKLKIDGIC